jgi:uncharacterized protein
LNADLVWLLSLAIFVVAILYSCVGHAGASGYIAVMTLAGLSTQVIKPTALALNILVASIAAYQFIRSGHFSWRLFWPVAVTSIPFAFLGGYINLPAYYFKFLLGAVLIYSAWRLVLKESTSTKAIVAPSLLASLVTGALIGLLSGLTGTGGGIFLTPLILLLGWALPKTAAGVSALFILGNSMAGLAGNWTSTQFLPPTLLWFLLSAGAGGFIGSQLGSQRLPVLAIKRCLALVLLIAGVKLLAI